MKLTALIPGAFLLTASAAMSQTEPLPIEEFAMQKRPFSAVIHHTGVPGQMPFVETSTDLVHWTLLDNPVQVSPGFFRSVDPYGARDDKRFYRPAADVPQMTPAWRSFYPINTSDGATPRLMPEFRWMPLGPTPASMPVTYRFELFDSMPDGSGGRTALQPALITRSGLTMPRYVLSGGDAEPLPGGDYLWRVTAVMPGREIPGSMIRLNNVLSPEGALFDAAPAGKPNWEEIFKKLNELAEKIKALQEALKDNDLVAEKELIDWLISLIRDREALKEALRGLLGGDTSAVDSPEKLKKMMELLQKLIDLILRYDGNLTEAQKQALKRLKERLKTLLEQLESAQDKAALIKAILEDLKKFLEGNGADATALRDYLTEALYDKLMEKLQEILAKKLGKKAAGALISILQDLINLGDAVIKVEQLKDLWRAYNKLLIDALKNANAGQPSNKRRFWGSVPFERLNCTIKLSYVKRCFKRDAGGGEYDGDWTTRPVPFSDGSTSITTTYDAISTGPAGNERMNFELPMELDPKALNCPPGEGPCMLILMLEINCPDCPSCNKTLALFADPIKC